MTRKTYHITKGDDGQWKGKLEGSQRASVSAETKAAAVERTIELAKQAPLGQVVIHKGNGAIQSERTYGKDPRKYLG